MGLRLLTGTLILAFALVVNVPGQQSAKQQAYRLSLPDKDWALEVSLGDFNDLDAQTKMFKGTLPLPPIAWFRSQREILSNDGRTYSLQTSRKPEKDRSLGFATVKILLTPAMSQGGALGLRDFALKKLDKENYVKRSSVKTWEHNQIPVARYTLNRAYDAGNIYTKSTPIVESGPRNVEAYFVKDGVWITLTLTASPFEEEEEKLFDSLLDSVTFVDTSVPSTSFDYYQKGRVLFLNKDYFTAAQLLGASLAIEQRGRQLDTPFWRDLIGKLADSYGALVNRVKAKEVLEYGISQEPSNSTFLMGLARLYATQGDVDNTLATLAKAALSFRNSQPPTSLPDLSYDPAFTRLMKIASFRTAVKAMRK